MTAPEPVPTEQPDSNAGEAAVEAVAAPETDGVDTDTDPTGKARKEAASYRRRLRETEADRDQLRGRLETWQLREAERLAGDRLATPADIWLGAALPQLLSDDGMIDPEKLGSAIDGLLKDRPHWSKQYRRPPRPDPSQASGAVRNPPVPGTQFSEFIKARMGR